jgi:hypothetical protein
MVAIRSAALAAHRDLCLDRARGGYDLGMSAPTLNWSTATVKGSKLTVGVDGEIPSGWKSSFDTTARLLGSGSGWGKVTLSKKKQTVSVGEVTEGSEERLRHYLESVVEQANTAHPSPEPEQDEEDEETGESGPDGRMTERFRAFAE